jgi:hypothetical protein
MPLHVLRSPDGQTLLMQGIDIARNFPVNVSDAESSVSRKQGSTSNEE